MYRIGIVGCGGIARCHIEGYRAVVGRLGEVVAGCDPDEKRLNEFCETNGLAERFTDAPSLIGSGCVDVIVLVTPPAVRRDVILPAIDKGIHLLVEKPFGETFSDARDFVEAAEKRGTMLAVNQQLRFMPDILAAKDIVDSGALGEINLVAHDHFQNRTNTGGWRSREKRLEISIFSIHVLDRIRWLMGKRPVKVSAVTRSRDPNVAGETFTSLTIQFDGGATGTMVSNWHSPGFPECRLRVDGSLGSLLSVKESILGDAAALSFRTADGKVQERKFHLKNAFAMGMGESMKRLLEAIDSGQPPVHSGRDNLDTMRIVDAAYASASRGGELVAIF